MDGTCVDGEQVFIALVLDKDSHLHRAVLRESAVGGGHILLAEEEAGIRQDPRVLACVRIGEMDKHLRIELEGAVSAEREDGRNELIKHMSDRTVRIKRE